MIPARKLDYYDVKRPIRIQLRQKQQSRRKKRKRMPETLLVCLVALFCVTGCLLYLGHQIHTMRLNVILTNLNQEIYLVQQEQAHLMLTLKQASRLSVIENTARLDLGMVEPSRTTVVVTTPADDQYSTSDGWIADSTRSDNVFEVVADWLNRWLPVGGVEAGRISRQ